MYQNNLCYFEILKTFTQVETDILREMWFLRHGDFFFYRRSHHIMLPTLYAPVDNWPHSPVFQNKRFRCCVINVAECGALFP